MKRFLLFWTLFPAAVLATGGFYRAHGAPPPTVYLIPISGDVEPSMAAFLKRALIDIPDTKETLIIVEMDTFGGRVDSALEMVDALVNVNQAETVAFVDKKAISAGALIALACRRLVMKHSTTIGDCAPITYSKEGPKMMGEKFQSPLRAKFRTLARRNGYPVTLAEAMVTAEMEVYRIAFGNDVVYMDDQAYQDLDETRKAAITAKQTVVAKGELLTMDDAEALDLGFSSMSVDGLAALLNEKDLTLADVKRIEPSWSEDLVRMIGAISPILMLIGLGALYTEIKAPGFGAPGIIGIACLALVFFHQYLVGLADFTELLIIVSGLVLLGFELFVIPGFGIAGIAGIVAITVGLVLSLQDFVIPDPKLPWERALLINNLMKVVSATVGSFLLALFVLRFVFPKLSLKMQGPYLAATLSDAHAVSPHPVGVTQGQTGTALTPLHPAGKAKIGDDVYDVITQGDFVAKGAAVRVFKIKGNRIVVLALDERTV
ncbi:MAG: serine protease [Desulfatitalea sp.]|nr:serine protease [Desulfatitalea sp.]NNJ99552.1 serine protease [Desulfatitalea sp.]